ITPRVRWCVIQEHKTVCKEIAERLTSLFRGNYLPRTRCGRRNVGSTSEWVCILLNRKPKPETGNSTRAKRAGHPDKCPFASLGTVPGLRFKAASGLRLHVLVIRRLNGDR